MTTDEAQMQRQNGFWRELLNGWMSILTEPSLDTFRVQKSRADPLKTVLGVGLLGLVLGIWTLATKPVSLATGTETVVVELLRVIFFTEADFFIISLIVFLIAKAFAGTGSFSQQSYLLSLVTVPLGMIVVAFLFVGEKLGLTLTAVLNPLSPIGVVSILIILFALYGFLLLLFTLQVTHEMQSSAVFYTLGVILIGWGILRVATMFAAGEENIITTEWVFIADQWTKGTVQELFIGHLWLVAFSVSIAVVLGVMMGIFITLPARRPRFSHLVFLIPLALFFLLWAASSGLLGEGMADQIMSTTRDWSRSLKRIENLYFGPLLAIVAAIIAKPAAAGMILAVFTIILYTLYLAGETASDLTLYIAGIILQVHFRWHLPSAGEALLRRSDPRGYPGADSGLFPGLASEPIDA